MIGRWLACLLLALPLTATAEQSITAGEFVVHYSAIASSELTPEVARAYAITRSAGRALVNIAVRRGNASDAAAVPAQVRGVARNDVGQTAQLWFREVREAAAIYYLAEPDVTPGEPLQFVIEVVPQGASTAISLSFSGQFFAAESLQP